MTHELGPECCSECPVNHDVDADHSEACPRRTRVLWALPRDGGRDGAGDPERRLLLSGLQDQDLVDKAVEALRSWNTLMDETAAALLLQYWKYYRELTLEQRLEVISRFVRTY